MNKRGTRRNRRRWSTSTVTAALGALTLLVAVSACGGSEDDDPVEAVDNQTEASEPEEPQPQPDDRAASDNFARVTIGSETFEIPPDGLNQCNNVGNTIFGSFAIAADGSATQAGGPDAATQINFGVPVSNWEEEEGLQAPLVNLDLLDQGVRWFASVDRGLGSVDSWELADGSARGEATFEAEEAGSGTVIGTESGSFEIVCQ